MSTKIVIVAGQRFSVPAETDNETIRQQLIGMGFADVANAEVVKGKEGEAETVEFKKKAGTKGLGPMAILERLPRVPSEQAGRRADARLITRLIGEQLTFEEAVAEDAALDVLEELSLYTEPKGARLCNALDQLPAVADASARPW